MMVNILYLLSMIYAKTNAQSCVGTPGEVKWKYWTGFTAKPDTNILVALETFPTHPDGVKILHSLSSTPNFTDNYAGLMRGYIHVPQTDNYIFNITGDDNCYFYLSDGESPANKRKVASVNGWSYVGEHDRDAAQTSATIQLQAGRYYYFEIYNFEGSSSDHVNLYWRKASVTPIVWTIIDANYLNDYACGQDCPVRGTACNDGNAATTNDVQDGFCNCVGVYPTTNACVGERGVVDAYYYDNITGGYVENDLINASKFPLLPDRRERLNGAYGPLVPSIRDSYGSLVQGYLTVPVSGIYDFNITGDNQTFFFLSKNDSIEYKQYHQALVFSGIGANEYSNSIFQNIPSLYLEKGKYYYYEFRHKDNTWRDYFNLHWKTPFQENRVWQKIPKFYLFDYKCEIACIAQGTPCDDGNPFTNNDQINNRCNCVGTPCSGADCNDLGARYQPYEKAGPTQNLNSTFVESSWLSCTVAPNPNPARSNRTRWIQYDFTSQYKFQGSRIWNYNVVNQTTKGFKNVVVDYSLDGITWQALGTNYLWPQAPGTSDYAGFLGPNFNNLKARYILISAVDSWDSNNSCVGFSKISFDATLCEPEGTACDDNDPLTKLDKFDANCNCRGIDINCAIDTLNLGRVSLTDSAFKAIKFINSENLVPLQKNITFTAGNSIVLLPGFNTDSLVIFTAQIANCLRAAYAANEITQKQEDTSDSTKMVGEENVEKQLKKIVFRLNAPAQVKLQLKDSNQKVIATIIDSYYENIGTQIKLLPTTLLSSGDYWVELTVGTNVLTEKFTL